MDSPNDNKIKQLEKLADLKIQAEIRKEKGLQLQGVREQDVETLKLFFRMREGQYNGDFVVVPKGGIEVRKLTSDKYYPWYIILGGPHLVFIYAGASHTEVTENRVPDDVLLEADLYNESGIYHIKMENTIPLNVLWGAALIITITVCCVTVIFLVVVF